LVLCSYVPEGSVVLLEQPEIHLHPSVQAGLADVLVETVRSRGVQVIVESHSEYLLQRLQRRIAEQAVSPDEAALYFCDIEKGESALRELDVDIFGNIRDWPRDFFGDSLGELAAMTEAAARRKSGQRTNPG
jgi:predicted ATPase